MADRTDSEDSFVGRETEAMKVVSYFEKQGGTYSKAGDYLIPNMKIPDPLRNPIGKYGQMRMRYLQEHRPGLYTRLILTGILARHLAEVDSTCTRYVETMVRQMAVREGVDETLKAADPMRWTGLMNNFRHCAEEIVLAEMVYD